MLIDWFHRRRAGAQLPDPGLVVETLSLSSDPRGHRCPGRAYCQRTRRRRCEKNAAGCQNVPISNRKMPSSTSQGGLLARGHGGGDTERQHLLDAARQDAAEPQPPSVRKVCNGKRKPASRNWPPHPAGSICHCPQGPERSSRRDAWKNAWWRFLDRSPAGLGRR